ncbi:alpha/beta fold hydrolase [Novosphingobium sp. BL-52-GroH]|uniref:alpha/beta fold hydrolase n=1 Tax=Novosphingobium sp. BL-52-GroH TaxID=3349877 RepID=UPI00384C8C85
MTWSRRMTMALGLAGAAAPVLARTVPARALRERFILPDGIPTEGPPPAITAPRSSFRLPDGGTLTYWDTGGDKPVVLLLHAATGSDRSWAYQVPALARAGYRVISFSRRGAAGSSPAPVGQPQSAEEDLERFIDGLGLRRLHLVGTAAGGIYALRYALKHPDRLRSLTISCSLGALSDPELVTMTRALLPPSFGKLPPELKELSPSYRAANPAGVKLWLDIEAANHSGAEAVTTKSDGAAPVPIAPPGPPGPRLADLDRLTMPVHYVYGDADLYAPPPLGRILAGATRRGELTVIAEAGHSAHWEQPRVFNRELLAFWARRRA